MKKFDHITARQYAWLIYGTAFTLLMLITFCGSIWNYFYDPEFGYIYDLHDESMGRFFAKKIMVFMGIDLSIIAFYGQVREKYLWRARYWWPLLGLLIGSYFFRLDQWMLKGLDIANGDGIAIGVNILIWLVFSLPAIYATYFQAARLPFSKGEKNILESQTNQNNQNNNIENNISENK